MHRHPLETICRQGAGKAHLFAPPRAAAGGGRVLARQAGPPAARAQAAAGGGGEVYSWVNRSRWWISPSARPPMTSAFSKRYPAPKCTRRSLFAGIPENVMTGTLQL